MPSLKDLKNRIGSVKSTQKITKAMKMVAAAKLRRATEHAEAARPYAAHMEAMLKSLASNVEASSAPALMAGTGKSDKHLIVVMSSDRGLCGGFNSSIVRSAKKQVTKLQGEGKEVKLFCVGRKGFEQVSPTHPSLIVGSIKDAFKKKLTFTDAQNVANQVQDAVEEHNIDICTIVFNSFKSALVQEVTYQQIIPLEVEEKEDNDAATPYEFEPDEEAILEDLLPRNISVQIFKALLENAASEQGSRMTAMDNATRNAGDMIDSLTLQYNRSRQASITSELIEIISGAEAV